MKCWCQPCILLGQICFVKIQNPVVMQHKRYYRNFQQCCWNIGKCAAVIGEIWISWDPWRYVVPLFNLCTELPKSKTNQKKLTKNSYWKKYRRNQWPGLSFSQHFLPEDLKVLFDTRARAQAKVGSGSLLSPVHDNAPGDPLGFSLRRGREAAGPWADPAGAMGRARGGGWRRVAAIHWESPQGHRL